MSKPQISQAIALVVNDHTTIFGGAAVDENAAIECLCGKRFPYHSRWAAHVSEAIVDRVLGGDL